MKEQPTPHNEKIEEAVLAAMLIEKDALDAGLGIITKDDFYNAKHAYIFEAIQSLYSESKAVDLLTVTQQLRESKNLDKAGGVYFISGISQAISSGSNIEYHSRILQQYGFRRKLIAASGKLYHDLFDEGNDVFDMLDKNYQSLNDISERLQRKQQLGMRGAIKANLDRIEKLRNNKAEIAGISTGFPALDKIISGWNPTDLIILAARPGMGKTGIALQSARFAAIECEKPVVFFSLEMGELQLVQRLQSAESKIDSFRLRTGNLNDEEHERLFNASANLITDNLIIDDTGGLKLFELKAKCNMLKRKHDIQAIFVDYLQLMTGKGDNREQEIGNISRGLKNIAKELNVPVIALSQLSRAVESRPNKRPQLSDLRDSGSIEQDADIVIFAYRPEYYGFTEDENGENAKGMAKLIIEKHRHGALADVNLKFTPEYTHFSEWGNDFEDMPEIDNDYGKALENNVGF